MEAKEKAERLIKRFSTYLSYDQTISKEWHSPTDDEWGKIKRKNAIKLAIICAEEMTDFKLVKVLQREINEGV